MKFEPDMPTKWIRGKVEGLRGTPTYFWPALQSTSFTATAFTAKTVGVNEQQWKTVVLRLDAGDLKEFAAIEKKLTPRGSIVISKGGHCDIVCKVKVNCPSHFTAFEAMGGAGKVKVRIKLVARCGGDGRLFRPIISSIEPVRANKMGTVQTCPICLEEETCKFPVWRHMVCCGVAVHNECRVAAFAKTNNCFWCRYPSQ